MRSIIFSAIAILLISCGDHEQKTTAEVKEERFDIEAVKKQVYDANKSYSKRFTTNDSMFYVDRYCLDAEVYSPNVPAVKGREAIRKFFYGDGKNTEASIGRPDGRVYGSADLVVEESTYNFPDGRGGSFDKGKFIALWKQEDGKWKLFREIWNTDLPAAK